jgi:glycosyltransferase involved in cell wall biosynthesis
VRQLAEQGAVVRAWCATGGERGGHLHAMSAAHTRPAHGSGVVLPERLYVSGETIVCLSRSRWDEELVSNRYHMLTRFARRNDVYVFEAPFELATLARPTPAKLRALATALAGWRQRGPRLWVARPLVWWMREGDDTLRALNLALYRPYARWLLRRAGVARPLLWLYDHRLWPLLEALPHRLACYHCTEDYPGLAGRVGGPALAAAVARDEAELLRRADLIFAVSPTLAADKRALNQHTILVANGVDTALYRPEHTCSPACAPVRDLPRPALVYTGNISYKVDLKLVGEVADAFPDGTVVLVGPVSGIADPAALAALRARPNVVFLGKRPARELPALLAHADVALIPFIREPWFVRAAQPLKTFEYLACGKPVVATPLDNLAALGDLVMQCGDTAAFVAGVQAALATNGPEQRARRVAAAQAHSWERRFAIVNVALRAALLRSRA